MSGSIHDVVSLCRRSPYIALVVLCLGAAAPGGSAEYHVSGSDPSCSDSSPGTGAQPWCTLEHAADQVDAGDTVWIHGGCTTSSS